MAGDWWQAENSTRRKPEVHAIMDLTGRSKNAVLGSLWQLWSWVDEQADADDQQPGCGIVPRMGLVDLVRECGEDEAYWEAVASVGWIGLEQRGVIIPGYGERFPEAAKKRALEARRKRIDRTQKQIDAEQETPRRRARRAPRSDQSSGDTIDMQAGADQLRESVFARLTLDMLADTRALLEWWDWACSQPRPVGLNDQWHQERLLAAAERARIYSSGAAKSPIKNPVGFVASVMGGKQWVKLEPEDLQRGKSRLMAHEKRTEQRTSDLRDCLQGTPAIPRPRTGADLRDAAVKFEQGRQKRQA